MTGRHRSRYQPTVAERAHDLTQKLGACEQLLDRARIFGEFGQGVSLFAAGHRERLEAEVEALAADVFASVLERVLLDGRSKAGIREDARKLARQHIDRAGGDGGILIGLVRDLADAHTAARALDDV